MITRLIIHRFRGIRQDYIAAFQFRRSHTHFTEKIIETAPEATLKKGFRHSLRLGIELWEETPNEL